MRGTIERPIPNAYIVPGTRLAAGEYPGSPPGTRDAERRAKLDAFIDAGISVFVDLTETREGLAPYAIELAERAAARGVTVHHVAMPIPDMNACGPSHMIRILDVIDEHLTAARGVYVHCWGGVGRTGMVVGCWLVRHGRTPDEALAEVGRLFRGMSPAKVARHQAWGSPQTAAQRLLVASWSASHR